MLGVGNLCIGAETYPDYNARGMIDLLLAGLAQPTPVRVELSGSGRVTSALGEAPVTNETENLCPVEEKESSEAPVPPSGTHLPC
jgi:hypothetical protein